MIQIRVVKESTFFPVVGEVHDVQPSPRVRVLMHKGYIVKVEDALPEEVSELLHAPSTLAAVEEQAASEVVDWPGTDAEQDEDNAPGEEIDEDEPEDPEDDDTEDEDVAEDDDV